MDCETTSVTELETKVARSIVEFYLQIANSARLQVSNCSCTKSRHQCRVNKLFLVGQTIDRQHLRPPVLAILLETI